MTPWPVRTPGCTALRDGEAVIILAIKEEGISIKYRLNLEETIQLQHLYRSTSARIEDSLFS